MTRLKLAVVGAGRLGGFHAQKLAARTDIELVGVSDPLAAARERVARECGCPAVADHRELYGRVDAVVIAAPTRLHHALGLEFLGRGVHVLMEKPLATGRAEAEELVSAADRAGALLQVGHVERFNPAFAAVAPQLAQPQYIEAVRSSGFTFRSTDVGVVLDLMIHDLELAIWLAASEVRRIDALGVSILGGHEDAAHVRLEFASGCVANLSACRVSRQPERRMSVWTRTRFAAIDFAARSAAITRPSDTLLERRFDVDQLTAAEVEHYKTHLLDEHLPCHAETFAAVDALALELDDFVASVRDGRSPQVTGADGCRAVAVAERILAAIGRQTGALAPARAA